MARISVDLTTLSGWDNLEAGDHNITVKAKAQGYVDSDASSAVVVTKEASGGYDFANDTWDVIFSQIKAGTDHYNLGDTKTDTINFGSTSYQCTWKIVDDTVGRYVTQSGQSHKVIEMQELVGLSDGSGVAWNGSGPMATLTSFANSDLFYNLNNTIYNFLSADLKAQLETTTVYSSNGSASASTSTNVGATGKLFVPCVTELYGNTTYGYANGTEGLPQYTYYAQQGVSTSNYDDLIKYNIEDDTSAGWYWTRSPYGQLGPVGSACTVRNGGSLGSVDVGDDFHRVAPCFAI